MTTSVSGSIRVIASAGAKRAAVVETVELARRGAGHFSEPNRRRSGHQSAARRCAPAFLWRTDQEINAGRFHIDPERPGGDAVEHEERARQRRAERGRERRALRLALRTAMDLAGQAVLGKPLVGPGIGDLGERGRGKKARDRRERSEAHHSTHQKNEKEKRKSKFAKALEDLRQYKIRSKIKNGNQIISSTKKQNSNSKNLSCSKNS